MEVGLTRFVGNNYDLAMCLGAGVIYQYGEPYLGIADLPVAIGLTGAGLAIAYSESMFRVFKDLSAGLALTHFLQSPNIADIDAYEAVLAGASVYSQRMLNQDRREISEKQPSETETEE